MPRQLALRMPTRVLYAAENFLVHAGVREVLENITQLSAARAFGALAVSGVARSGRTHFSIFLVDYLTKQGAIPYLIEGPELAEFMNAPERLSISPLEIFVVDNAEQYFSGILPGASGPFVDFFERVRRGGGQIIFLFSEPQGALPCDEHILSRLKAATVGRIVGPSESDMPELIRMMARQRGFRLSPKKVDFLVNRLGRSVPSVDEYFDRVQHLTEVFGRPIQFPLLQDAL